MAIAGGLAALASIAAPPIIGAIAGQPGQRDNDPFLGFDPFQALMLELFGTPTVLDRSGGFRPTRGKGPGTGAITGLTGGEGIFGDTDFGALSDLLNPVPLNEAQEAAFDAAGLAAGQVDPVLDFLTGPLAGASEQLVDDGFRVDVEQAAGPLLDLAERRFRRETTPNIVNKFARIGGTDLAKLLADAGSDTETELASVLAQLQVNSDESAAGRRASGLSTASLLNNSRFQFPLAAADSLRDVGTSLQSLTDSQQPGNRLLQVLASLRGLTPTGFSATPNPPARNVFLDSLASSLGGQTADVLGQAQQGGIGFFTPQAQSPNSTTSAGFQSQLNDITSRGFGAGL